MRFTSTFFLPAICALFSLPALAVVPIVSTVPFDAANDPHTAIIGVTITLGAIVNLQGSSDSFTYSWNFGDGSAATAPAAVTNPYDISSTHSYTGTAGQTWSAVVTVTDTTTHQSASKTYPVILAVNSLSARVNIALDKGLWFLHTSMWRQNTPANGQPVNTGGWDTASGSPGCANGFDCTSYGGLDATNVQAYEVSGHFESGAASDPYTDDVARGLARMEYFLVPHPLEYDVDGEGSGLKQFMINPATSATRCSDGSVPTGYGTATQSCPSPATLISEIPHATSCTAPPCTVTFDQNNNGQLVNVENDSGDPGYQRGMFIDALVATGNGHGTAKAGVAAGGGLPGVLGQTYSNLVTDISDTITYCQNPYDPYGGYDNGYDDGGAWEYTCAVNDQPYYNDNSPSQWNAIGLIAGSRGFGLAIPQITKDMNQVWVTWSQDWVGLNGGYADSGKGAYGYSEFNYYPWGPFADTPSGMVQLAMDGAGRTAAGAADQRWNMAETFYRDNFCNAPSGGATQAPRAYTYGLFSFTKAMLLHDPAGALTPITYLADQPSNTNQIDWYAAQAASGDPCDGVAQTLVTLQNPAGYWYGNDYYGTQYFFETGWSIIMLQKTVFNTCVNDLTGAGTAGGRAHPPRIDLTWTALPANDHITGYNILRGTSNAGPYSRVGSSTLPAYSDTSGLTNNHTYFYVLQPQISTGTFCQSTQAEIAVP